MDEERLNKIEAILERTLQVQESNSRAVAALVELVLSKAHQQNQNKSDIQELASDLYQTAGDYADFIEANTEKIDLIMTYLSEEAPNKFIFRRIA